MLMFIFFDLRDVCVVIYFENIFWKRVLKAHTLFIVLWNSMFYYPMRNRNSKIRKDKKIQTHVPKYPLGLKS